MFNTGIEKMDNEQKRAFFVEKAKEINENIALIKKMVDEKFIPIDINMEIWNKWSGYFLNLKCKTIKNLSIDLENLYWEIKQSYSCHKNIGK